MTDTPSTASEPEVKARKELLNYFLGNKEDLKHYVVRPHRSRPGYTLAFSSRDENGNDVLRYETDDVNYSTTHAAAEICAERNMRVRMEWLLSDHPGVLKLIDPSVDHVPSPKPIKVIHKPAAEGTKLCELSPDQLRPGMEFRLIQADGTMLPAMLTEIIIDSVGVDVRFMTDRGRARCSITDKEVEAYVGFTS